MKYQVDKEIKLFDFLIQKTGKKRKDIKQLLKYKNVYVDDNVQTYYAFLLTQGQIVEIKSTKNELPFPILYEDKDIIVIDKPCGLLSEKTGLENQKTAYYIVKQYLLKKKENIYLVHRLDQYTSGILMFVKTKKLYEVLTHHWNEYVKIRGYQAIVEGQIKPSQGVIDNYLAESKTQNVYITSSDKGKRAITKYRVIQFNHKYSLLEVYLETGRKNQIRVHFSSINHPLVGDLKYGAKTNPIKRLGLHAHEFMIIHPLTKKEMHFYSTVPQSFHKLFKKY